MESVERYIREKGYEEIKLLGKGKGGYSYLVSDGEAYYVLKQIHHEPCDYYQFGDKMAAELGDYEKLSRLQLNMPQMLDYDKEQEVILKQYIEGPTVQALVEANQLDDRYIEEMHQISKHLERANVNIDYYPTNFVIEDGKMYYVDYECNDYMEEWSFQNWGIHYWQNKKK